MRLRSVLAAAVALSAGPSAARANPGPTLPMPLAGSDTMREITLDVIAACNVNANNSGSPLTSHLRYDGGGSSLGGQRLNPVGTFAPNGQQQIAPQSRFLNATECNFFGTNRGQGIQIGLDGIGVYHDKTDFSPCDVLRYAGKMPIRDLNRVSAALDLNGDGDTADLLEPALGYGLGALGLDDGVAPLTDNASTPDCNEAVEYCFTHWADVLRILYTGLTAHEDDSSSAAACKSTATTAAPVSARRCNSDVRHTLVSDWSNMFDTNGDDGAGGCADDSCPVGLSHAWRRDDLSGTTDTFLSLIGAAGVGTAAAPVRTFCNGIENEDLDPVRRDCKTGTSSGLDTDSVCGALPMRNRNLPFDSATGNPTGAGTTNVASSLGSSTQQYEPKTACAAASDCTAAGAPVNATCAAGFCQVPSMGDLGVLLAISLPPTTVLDKSIGAAPGTILVDPTTGQAYNPQYDQTACTSAGIGSGRVALAEMPFSALSNSQRCPSGSPRSGNKCLWPTQAANLSNGKAGWFNCKTKRTNRLTGAAAPWVNYDARAYNRVPRHPQTGELLLPDNTAAIKDPRFTGGGDARIHMQLPAISPVDGVGNPTHPACTQPDATTQIGCLVQSDPCSIGYAGLEAEDGDIDDGELAILGINAPLRLRSPLDQDPAETDSGDLELDPRTVSIQRLADPSDAACVNGTSDFDIRYPLARILWLNSAKGYGGAGAFPGALSIISNLVDSDPDFTQVDPSVVNGSQTPDGTPDLLTRENDLVQCYTNRTLVDPILQDHGFITLPLAQPAANRLRTCP